MRVSERKRTTARRMQAGAVVGRRVGDDVGVIVGAKEGEERTS